jgi:hypothetical protein
MLLPLARQRRWVIKVWLTQSVRTRRLECRAMKNAMNAMKARVDATGEGRAA